MPNSKNIFFGIIYGGVWIFLRVKFATSLNALLAGDKYIRVAWWEKGLRGDSLEGRQVCFSLLNSKTKKKFEQEKLIL